MWDLLRDVRGGGGRMEEDREGRVGQVGEVEGTEEWDEDRQEGRGQDRSDSQDILHEIGPVPVWRC